MSFGEPSPCSVDKANRFMVERVKKETPPPMWNRVKRKKTESIKTATGQI